MRKTYNQFSDRNINNDFSYSQDGYITPDMGSNFQFQQQPEYLQQQQYVQQTQYAQQTQYPQQPQYPQQMYNSNFFNPNSVDNQQVMGISLPNDFMTNAALQYGSTMMEQGSDILQRNIEKYVPTSTLKYYFAVDNLYVAKKLALLTFPFMHKNWSVQYNQDKQPVPPRYEINAPDLYIPMMALLTYILNCGFMYGIHGRFSPEQLGVMASNAIGWLIGEIVMLMLIMYIVNAKTSLRYTDMIAFSGYKFVGMNFILLLTAVFETYGYYCSLAYFSLALGYFLVRTLKIQISPPQDLSVSDGNRRQIYLLMVTALVQPVVMWLLTRSVVV